MPHTVHHAAGVSLRSVLSKCTIVGADDIRVRSCCSQAERCQPGDLYVALVHDDGDGHDDAYLAVQRGASAVLSERLLPVSVPNGIVSDTRVALGRVCQALAGNPSQYLRTVGITGTHGKTVTARLMAAVLREAGGFPGHLDSLSCSNGQAEYQVDPERLQAVELANWLGSTAANGCTDAVVEMSSRALAQRQTTGMGLDVAIVTNVRRNHLDLHGNTLNYRNAKARILRHLKPSGVAVLNADDAATALLLTKLKTPVITVGMRMQADLSAQLIESHSSEQSFLLHAGRESIPVRTAMIGDYHIYNCLSVTAAALVMGLDLTTIVRGLESVKSLPARMERIECGQPFSVYVDRCATADRLAVNLHALRRVVSGRILCVLAADAPEAETRAWYGKTLERGAEVGVLTGRALRRGGGFEEIHDVLDGYERPARAQVMPDRVKAIQWALQQAQPGDAILLAGKGAETYRGGESKHAVHDQQLAADWLYRHAHQAGHTRKFAHVLPFVSSN